MAINVLLIDDEADFIEPLAERLRTRGMTVTTATSAPDALALVEKNDFDVVILDYQMPEMDGITALKAIQDRKPNLHVILLTGHATIERSVEAMKLGAKDFVEKPTDVKALSEKIQKAHEERMIAAEKEIEEKIKKIIGKQGW